MALVVRFLGNMDNWNKEPDWLNENHIPADILQDLRTTQNTLSIFRLPSEDDLERLIAAFYTSNKNKDKFQKQDYVIFQEQIIDELKLNKDENANGNTPDKEVNSWHFNLKNLTGQDIIRLANALFKSEGLGRKKGTFVCDSVKRSYDSGWLEEKEVNENLIAKIKN